MSKIPHTYKGKDITVTWDSNICIHAAECIAGLPRVFNTRKKPWIVPDNADAEKVAEQIKKCPSAALQYELTGTASS